ncbi:MAG: salt stress protein, Slr1339 family [Rivularia sp. (in: cyanobacteria)]
MDSIDKLLSELKTEYQQPANSPESKIEEVDRLKKAKTEKLDSSVLSSSLFASSSPKKDAIDSILSEIKQDFEEKQLLDEQQKQQEIENERIRQEKLKEIQVEALKNKAKEWLEKLEPLSQEGLWFESFAQNYPSKLEAAIEYLQES